MFGQSGRFLDHLERMARIERGKTRSTSWPRSDPNAEAWARGRRVAELEHEGKVCELEAEVARLNKQQDARVISELRALAAQMWALRDTRDPDRSTAWNDGVGGCAVMTSDRVQELKSEADS